MIQLYHFIISVPIKWLKQNFWTLQHNCVQKKGLIYLCTLYDRLTVCIVCLTWLSSCRALSLTSRSSAWAWASLSLTVISLSCSSFMAFFFGDSFQWPPPPPVLLPRDMWCCRKAECTWTYCTVTGSLRRNSSSLCVCYLPALVELSDSVLHLSEWAQRLQLPQLHLLHLLLQSRHVVLIRQAAAPLDGHR